MQKISRKWLTSVLFLISSGLAVAQSNPLRFCSGGIMPDAYPDWTKLPAAAAVSSTGVPVAVKNVTIPVANAPGLTVSVSIDSKNAILPSLPAYAVKSVTDLSVNSANTTITLEFSKDIRGFSVSIPTQGRFQRQFTLNAYEYDQENYPDSLIPAQVTSSSFDSPSTGEKAETPLQIRAESAIIRRIVLQVTTADAEYFALDLVNARVETGNAADASAQIPKSGLIQWLRADQVFDPYDPIFRQTWPDASPNHANANVDVGSHFQAREVGGHCAPVVIFDGASSMTARLPINGLDGMTIFLVSSSDDDAAGWWEKQALIFDEDSAWGTTFVTPSQTHVFFRFGTTQQNNEPIYSRPVNVAGDLTVTTVTHNGSTDSLEVNGVPVLQQSGKLRTITGVSSTERLGAGLLGTHFFGQIGEVLVYNRALSAGERDVVNHYLMQKFGSL